MEGFFLRLARSMGFKKADVFFETITEDLLGIPNVEVELVCSVGRDRSGLEDFVDFIDLPAGRLGIAVGRVTAKEKTDEIVEFAGRCVREIAEMGVGVGEVIQEASALLGRARLAGCQNISMFFGILDSAGRALEYAKARGDGDVLLEKDGATVFPKPVGLPLDGSRCEKLDTGLVDLARGQKLVFCTDGAAALPKKGPGDRTEIWKAGAVEATCRYGGRASFGLARRHALRLGKRAQCIECCGRGTAAIIAVSTADQPRGLISRI